VQVLVSDDGGSNWDEIVYPDMNLCTQSGGKQQSGSYYYDGTKGGYNEFYRQPTSTGDTGNLNAYRGENILFKFWFGADEYTEIEPEYDGFYIDNINIYRGSNESNQIWSLYFESVLPVSWFKDDPWDKTVATPSAGNLCSFGQFLVGINSGYVAKDNYLDTTVDDWTAICDWNDDVGQNCFFQNTQNTSLANLEVREYCYTDLNTPHISNEDYIIVDVYVENIGSTTLTNIYPGIQFDLQVVAPPDYNIYNDMVSANYSSSHPLIWFYDEGKSDELCVGVSLLGAGLVNSAYNDNLHSAKFTQISTIYYFIDNSILWNYLSTSGTDTPPSFAGNHAFVMSTHISSLGVGETYRFCFAVIGGDSSTDIQTNSDIAYLEFQDIEVDPKVSIINTSLGKIKSIFME
jgi:hypothetical protein